MNKKIQIKLSLILLIIFVLIVSFPRPTRAFIGTGIFDYFETALEGVEESSAPVAQRIFFLFFAALFGIMFLLGSASLLQWIIENPQWLTLKNPVVESGLHFVTGLTNLFIILVFVIIAIAYILKIETFQAKKALPKLIIVALLINFVRVFIGIPIDIANIVQQSIIDAAGTDIVMSSLEAVFGGIWETIGSIISWLIALTVMFMIPFIGPFAQYGMVVFVVSSVLFLPVLLTWIIQTALAVLLGGVFLFLSFIFACRIFVIWFLTIFAPLALLCTVLPQTQKYWKEWLQHLVSWLTFGLIIFLFLVIGFRGAEHLAPQGTPPIVPGFAWFALPSYFGYYFFLFVFFALAAWLAKKTAPEIATVLIASGTAFIGMVGAAGATLGKGMVGRARETRARQEEAREKYLKEKEEAEKAGRKLSLMTRATKGFGTWAGAGLARGTGWMHRQITGTTIEEAEAKRLKKLEGEAMKIETPHELESKIKDAKRAGDTAALRALASAGIEKGREFKKIVTEQISPEQTERLGAMANKQGRSKEAERLARAYIDKLDEVALTRMGFKLEAEDLAKGYDKIWKKLIGEAKGDDIKDLAKNFWDAKKHPRFMAAIQTFWGGPQIRKAAEEFGRGFIIDYTEPIEAELKRIKTLPPSKAEKEYKAFVYTNPGRARYHETTAAQELGCTSFYAAAPPGVKKKYKNIREILAEKP